MYPGILLLLAFASLIDAFENEEPYNGAFGEDGDDVGKDYGGPHVYESPSRRAGGRRRQGEQCQANGECSGQLNCCRTSGSVRKQCWPCLGRHYQCQRQTDCASPLVCSQPIDPQTRQPYGVRRCIALELNRPPPPGEYIVGRRAGK